MFAAEAEKLETVRDPALDARLRQLAIDHYDFVWRSLRRLGVMPPETDDAAQRVFLTLAQKLPNVEPSKERSYVFGIVVRVAANARRGRATARQREVPESDVPSSLAHEATAEAALSRAEERVMLDEILACLPEERRIVFMLFELEELTLVEITELLGIPIGTVTSRLRRAREEFEAAAARLRARNKGV
ncbi:RNA polymerase sigma factor RpoE [Labilithrix luteola]|uniref:RNA polymerase sigma factor RpoE n=1 Tax=Labilithrix luteola TaxID=1391654 RepID=A0A0K1PUY6_9BACT|nr:sigma-70 family RNA polymerase sigma factor [Labilithrix luteola]AKU97340.1 RNA polymerase sigma factor RpoE [Labilithrix luteola]